MPLACCRLTAEPGRGMPPEEIESGEEHLGWSNSLRRWRTPGCRIPYLDYEIVEAQQGDRLKSRTFLGKRSERRRNNHCQDPHSPLHCKDPHSPLHCPEKNKQLLMGFRLWLLTDLIKSIRSPSHCPLSPLSNQSQVFLCLKPKWHGVGKCANSPAMGRNIKSKLQKSSKTLSSGLALFPKHKLDYNHTGLSS
ncbi:unnamed protein product [Lepidochelys olivacea]